MSIKKKQFIEGLHYYLDNGSVVMTEQYHIERGQCCGSGCKNCCYWPRYTKGSVEVKTEKDLKNGNKS